MIGRNPNMKIIQATHTTELAVSFGRKVKNLLEREDYQEIFLKRSSPQTPKHLVDGTLLGVVCTTPWVWDRTLPDEVVT